jgi:hypothetical protein
MARRTDSNPRTSLDGIRPGTDPSRLIDKLYSTGRHYPREAPQKWPARPVDASRYDEQGQGKHRQPSAPQFIEDGRRPEYSNDTSGWIRGAPNGRMPDCNNEDATRLPNFDRSNAWRKDRESGMRDQIKDSRDADHRRHWTEFEKSHNAGRTAATEFHDRSKRAVPGYERKLEYGFSDSHPKRSRKAVAND